jgi:hypothetical protein
MDRYFGPSMLYHDPYRQVSGERDGDEKYSRLLDTLSKMKGRGW